MSYLAFSREGTLFRALQKYIQLHVGDEGQVFRCQALLRLGRGVGALWSVFCDILPEGRGEKYTKGFCRA